MSKFCKDCAWSVRVSTLGPDYLKCQAPQNARIVPPPDGSALHLVTGETKYTDATYTFRYIYCTTQRSGGWIWALMDDKCGPQGRWWTAKP